LYCGAGGGKVGKKKKSADPQFLAFGMKRARSESTSAPTEMQSVIPADVMVKIVVASFSGIEKASQLNHLRAVLSLDNSKLYRSLCASSDFWRVVWSLFRNENPFQPGNDGGHYEDNEFAINAAGQIVSGEEAESAEELGLETLKSLAISAVIAHRLERCMSSSDWFSEEKNPGLFTLYGYPDWQAFAVRGPDGPDGPGDGPDLNAAFPPGQGIFEEDADSKFKLNVDFYSMTEILRENDAEKEEGKDEDDDDEEEEEASEKEFNSTIYNAFWSSATKCVGDLKLQFAEGTGPNCDMLVDCLWFQYRPNVVGGVFIYKSW
jgi:hypothetical protein